MTNSMPPKSASGESRPQAFLKIISGEDEFAVKQRARKLYRQWCDEIGGMDHEIVDAAVNNSSEAVRALGRLRMALDTLPFFGTGKVVWFQNCNFLGDERTAESAAVTEALGDLSTSLKAFPFDKVRLLITAGKVDKRKSFFKTVEKIGQAETLDGWSLEDKDWAEQAAAVAEQLIHAAKKTISPDALPALVANVGPNSRQLANEVEKLLLYIGLAPNIELEDVEKVISKNKLARAFGLGDAIGDRNLPKLLKVLDEELWSLKFDSKKSAIGLLYGLISKVRTMILVKEMIRDGWIKPSGGTAALQTQLARIPKDTMPEDKRYNPAMMHPFVLLKTIQHAQNYALDELIAAMDSLLQCNRKLVSSATDDGLLLQTTLIGIVMRAPGLKTAARQNSPA